MNVLIEKKKEEKELIIKENIKMKEEMKMKEIQSIEMERKISLHH